MVELRSEAQFEKAIERAKKAKLFVQASGLFRLYYVTNRETGAQYSVNFFVRSGRRFGECTCKAGMNNVECKHLAAAVALHLVRAEAKRAIH
jgi:hypothetical protein